MYHNTTPEADGWRWLTCLHLPVVSQAKLVAGLGVLAAQGLQLVQIAKPHIGVVLLPPVAGKPRHAEKWHTRI